MQPHDSAFIGREAGGEDEGWISLIKHVGTDCISPLTKPNRAARELLALLWTIPRRREVPAGRFSLPVNPPWVHKVKQHPKRASEDVFSFHFLSGATWCVFSVIINKQKRR